MEDRYSALQRIALVVDKLGTVAVFFVASGAYVLLLLVYEKFSEAAIYGVALILFAIAVGGLKFSTRVPRPKDSLVKAEFSSFPSGHAAGATLYASMTTYTAGLHLGFEEVIPLALALSLWALIVAWSRIELRAHRPVEVFAGIGLALLISSAVILFKEPIQEGLVPLIQNLV